MSSRREKQWVGRRVKLKHKIKLCRGPNRAGLAEVFVPDNVWKHSWESRELIKPEGRTPFLCIHSESSALPFSCSWLVAFDLLESHPKPASCGLAREQ